MTIAAPSHEEKQSPGQVLRKWTDGRFEVKKWKVLNSSTIFKNQWFDIKEEKVQVSDALAVEGVIVHNFADWVNVVPLTDDGRVILESQYRHGMGVVTVETPSGTIESDDKGPKEAGERELYEETGYAAKKLIFLGKSQALPQLMNNHIHHFLALGCHLVDQPKPEIGGRIEFWLEDWAAALQKVRGGEISQGYTVEGILRAEDWMRQNPERVKFRG